MDNAAAAGVWALAQRDSEFDCVELNAALVWRASGLKRFVASGFVERNSMLISVVRAVGGIPCA